MKGSESDKKYICITERATELKKGLKIWIFIYRKKCEKMSTQRNTVSSNPICSFSCHSFLRSFHLFLVFNNTFVKVSVKESSTSNTYIISQCSWLWKLQRILLRLVFRNLIMSHAETDYDDDFLLLQRSHVVMTIWKWWKFITLCQWGNGNH